MHVPRDLMIAYSRRSTHLARFPPGLETPSWLVKVLPHPLLQKYI